MIEQVLSVTGQFEADRRVRFKQAQKAAVLYWQHRKSGYGHDEAVRLADEVVWPYLREARLSMNRLAAKGAGA